MLDMATGFRLRSWLMRSAAIVGAIIAVAGMTLATATPASAGRNCPRAFHCVFWTSIADNVRHDYFDSDANFTDDTFTNGANVNDNTWAASNTSTGGFESHYYYDINNGGGLVFCVNPGHDVDSGQLSTDGIPGNHVGQRDEISSLRLRPTTTIPCF